MAESILMGRIEVILRKSPEHSLPYKSIEKDITEFVPGTDVDVYGLLCKMEVDGIVVKIEDSCSRVYKWSGNSVF